MDKNILYAVILFMIAGLFFYRNLKAKKSAELHLAEGQKFLEENGKTDGVITTESGLQYLILEEGEGEIHPTPKDTVNVHYHGTLIDGTVFDSSVQRGKPITFGVKQVIRGWQEGLQYMVKGQKMRLFIPANLAYGRRGIGKIPPGSLLIFDVTLIDIV